MTEMKSNRYECLLDERDLEKAVFELNEPESNDERLKHIDDLRNAFVNEYGKTALARYDDAFILRFLRARKFDHDKALKMLKNYHVQHQNWPEVFDKVKNPALVRHVFDAGCVIGLKGKAKDGSSLCIGRPGKIEKAILTDFIATLVLSIEHMLEDEMTQIYGITVIEDMSYLGLGLAQQMGPSIGKRFTGLLQDAMPVRVKAINIVNEPTLFDVFLAIIRPFMKEKMKKRLKVHGSTFDALHNIIDSLVLPPAYGGTGNVLDGEVTDSWRDAVLGEDSYL